MIISLSNINFGGGSGGGGGTVRVIDNLESTASTAALSAKQGKVLGDHFSESDEVVARAYNQLDNKIAGKLANTSAGVSSWSDVTYMENGFVQVEINGQDEGVRLHVSGKGTEKTNPRIDQITTSESVLRIKTLTQDEYDALDLAGELDNNTLYAIVEPVV